MKNKIICIVFVLLIFGFTAFDLATPDRDFSEWENRTLAKMPKADVGNILEGKFGSDYEKYMTDQFTFRDTFVKVKFVADSILGKRDQGGVYIGENALYTKLEGADFEKLDKNIASINAFAEKTGIETTVLVVPSSTYIYEDRLPKFGEAPDEKFIFSHIKKNLTNAEFVDITNKLFDSRENYIYFRTDHHWTSDGALIGYNEILTSLGKEALTRDDFEIKTVSESFVGTLSSKSGALGIDSDTIERFDRGGVSEVLVWDGVGGKVYNSLYFEEYLQKKDKYSYFLGTNQPIVSVKTENEGGKLLVFKDSYAHIMAPMMTGDWSEIVFVDLRYINGKIDTVLENALGISPQEFDNVLFLYSSETFTTQYNMQWLKY